MNNQGLLALAQLILPSEILTNFEVVHVEEEASLIRIYLDESVKAEYKESPEIESKGFCEAKEPPYAELHVRWCERSVNTKIGDKHL